MAKKKAHPKYLRLIGRYQGTLESARWPHYDIIGTYYVSVNFIGNKYFITEVEAHGLEHLLGEVLVECTEEEHFATPVHWAVSLGG